MEEDNNKPNGKCDGKSDKNYNWYMRGNGGKEDFCSLVGKTTTCENNIKNCKYFSDITKRMGVSINSNLNNRSNDTPPTQGYGPLKQEKSEIEKKTNSSYIPLKQETKRHFWQKK